MPRYQEEERIYHKGFRDGYSAGYADGSAPPVSGDWRSIEAFRARRTPGQDIHASRTKKTRKPSAWNKFVKVNSKKKQYRYANGKVNLKKLGVAWRKKKRGR
jgi:hypothetical protein